MIIIPGESIAALDRIGPVLPDPRLAVPVSIMPIPARRRGSRGPGPDSRFAVQHTCAATTTGLVTTRGA